MSYLLNRIVQTESSPSIFQGKPDHWDHRAGCRYRYCDPVWVWRIGVVGTELIEARERLDSLQEPQRTVSGIVEPSNTDEGGRRSLASERILHAARRVLGATFHLVDFALGLKLRIS